jgi:DNA-binding CsgD family transcriptional regulator
VDAGSFVGRDSELSRLAEMISALGDGVGNSVLVEGEQGIGKTALLRTALASADEAGIAVLWAAADDMLRPFPLRLMVECIGETVALASPGTADAHADLVEARMERLLSEVDRLCGSSPVILVAEDLQWSDEASVLMLNRLSRAAAQMPLLVVGSARPGSGRPDLDQLRRALTSRGGVTLSLDRLTEEDVALQVSRLLGGRTGHGLAQIASRAGGNPLYVRELADSLLRDGNLAVRAGEWDLVPGAALLRVPRSLAAAITDRLDGLSADVAEVLRWGSVLGSEFLATDLSVVTGRSAGALIGVVDASVDAGVLAGVGSRLRFRHAVIRQVLYERSPPALRAALHLQAAQALAEAGASPERIAAHLAAGRVEAGSLITASAPGVDWVAGWLVASAPTVTFRAPDVTAHLLRDLLAQLPASDERRVALQANLVRAAFQLAHDDEVERTAAALLTGSSEPDLAAEMAWLVGHTQLRAGRWAEARSTVESAFARPGLSALRAGRLLALRTVIMAASGELTEADRAAPLALELARQAGDPIGAGYAMHAMALAAFVRRDDASAVVLCDQVLREIGDDPEGNYLRCVVLGNKSGGLQDLDRFDEALASSREELMLAESAVTPRLPGARYRLADQYFTVGLWDDALAELEPAIGLPADDFQLVLVNGLRALIAVHQDDRPTADALLTELPDQPLNGTDLAVLTSAFHDSQARAAVTEQDHGPVAAAAVLAPCLEPDVGSRVPGRSLLLPTLVRLAIAAEDPALAARAADAAAGEAEAAARAGSPQPLKAALASHCRGLSSGDPRPVLSAADYLEATRRPLLEAAAREDAAVLLAHQGDRAAARAALNRACHIYAGLGASWDLRRAASRLRPLGIRPLSGWVRRQASGWAALTPTELRVAALVAEGRSNPDIAAELFLSRNTVQTHVSHILAKLGARSRAEIVRAALQQPLLGSLSASSRPMAVPNRRESALSGRGNAIRPPATGSR